MTSQLLHGIYWGTSIVLVTVGVTKLVFRRAMLANRGPSQPSPLDRALVLHEKRPRLVGAIEAAIGVLALMNSSSLWPAVLVSGLGLVFSAVLMLRARVMPTRDCGCVRTAVAGAHLQLSSVCRAMAICVGGACGLASETHGIAFARGSVGAALAWIVGITALSPEWWQHLNFRCGRPLAFSVRDDRRRLVRSSEYQRLRDVDMIAQRPSDVWSEGCVRYFVFPIQDRSNSQVAVFQVGPSGVYGRILPRPASPALEADGPITIEPAHLSDETERTSFGNGVLPS